MEGTVAVKEKFGCQGRWLKENGSWELDQDERGTQKAQIATEEQSFRSQSEGNQRTEAEQSAAGIR